MINKDKAEALSKARHKSSMLKNVKDFLVDLLDKQFAKTLNVKVDNLNTTLDKEIAKNTRGLKGRLDQLIKKEPKDIKVDVSVDTVKVSNLKDIEIPIVSIPETIRISNLSEIEFPEQKTSEKPDFSPQVEALGHIEQAVHKVHEYLPTLIPKEFPKIVFPKQTSIKEAKDIVKSIKTLQQTVSDDLLALSKVIKAQEVGGDTNEKGMVEVEVKNFPPQHIPTPVTNISINSLRGIPLSTVVEVGTSPTLLPETALEQRRSMILFNNSGNTVYLGGVDVTTSTGLPLLDQSYSPSLDAGEHMKVYAVAGSANNEVRVFQVSSDKEGN